MLASKAGIVFPALILVEDDMYYSEAFSLRDLDHVGWELVDSTGQRFLIREFSAIPLPWERGTSLWSRWWKPWLRPHLCDAELEPLPLESFNETLRKVVQKEVELEDYWVFEGGGRDPPEHWDLLRQCRSIAEIIDWNIPPPGSPTVADSIVEDLHKLWLWITFRGGRKRPSD